MTETEQDTETREGESYGLAPELVQEVLRAAETSDRETLGELLEPLHAADIADLIEQIGAERRAEVIALAPHALDGEVLSELDEGIREDVIPALHPVDLAVAVRDLETDDVVDLVEDLDAPQAAAILEALDEPDRAAVKRALSYPEYSAGRLMQREVVISPEHWTVGESIDFMRRHDDLPEQFYHIIIVDPRLKPIGYVTLGKILSSPRDVRLADILEPSFRPMRVTTPEKDVAYAFNQYHLISAPVVDDDDRLVGVITIDDAMVVLDEEAEEDIYRLAGVGEGSITDRVIETTRGRLPWLAVNLVTAILASFVIAQFEDAIARIVALAVLMPIVASMGGNAGTQALTVAVRALATHDLTGANAVRVVRREALVGLVNGLVFASIMGLVGAFWFGWPMLGAVIGSAMIINLVVAGLAGVLVPLGLERLGIDPALASGAFVTTVTDVVGFFAFLGLAVLWLI